MSVKKKKIAGMISILEGFGTVEKLDDNILTFQRGNAGKKVYLRYSIGKTFSFIKGSCPTKIQIKKGFETNPESFKEKLLLILSLEKENGYKVEEIYLGNIYLNKQLPVLNEHVKGFELKNNRLERNFDYYKIFLNMDGNLVFILKSDYLSLRDVESCKKVLDDISENMERIKMYML